MESGCNSGDFILLASSNSLGVVHSEEEHLNSLFVPVLDMSLGLHSDKDRPDSMSVVDCDFPKMVPESGRFNAARGYPAS